MFAVGRGINPPKLSSNWVSPMAKEMGFGNLLCAFSTRVNTYHLICVVFRQCPQKLFNLFPLPRRMKHDGRSRDWKWKLCSFKDVIMHRAWFYVMKPCILNIIILGLLSRIQWKMRHLSCNLQVKLLLFAYFNAFSSSAVDE